MDYSNVSEIKENIGVRPRDSHKGTYGKVLVMAGSKGMAGAACLAGLAAYRTGAGLVTFAVPETLFPILQTLVPEGICIARTPGKIDYDQYDSIILGPGLGQHKQNDALIKEVLELYHGPLVLDADAINSIVRFNLYQDILDCSATIVMTPHPGEAKRLMGTETISDREEFAVSISKTFGATVVLKGAGTVIAAVNADKSSSIRMNPNGNPGMATAGSGDVLAGVIGAYLGMGLTTFKAAVTGVYVHGAAGDLAALELGENGMIASDLCNYLPYAIKNICEML